jgi:hypothetical protein
LLGWPALALSIAAIALTALAGPYARRGDLPAGAFAALDVLLPWTLGMLAAGWPGGEQVAWSPIAVAVAITALQWGVLRAATEGRRGAPVALTAGALALVAALAALRMPAAAALAAVLMAPPLYWLTESRRDAEGPRPRIAWAGPWLMLTLFVAALALR